MAVEVRLYDLLVKMGTCLIKLDTFKTKLSFSRKTDASQITLAISRKVKIKFRFKNYDDLP